MEITMETLHGDMVKLQQELIIVKNILMSEGELTDWAKKELKKARAEKKEKYKSLEDLREEILEQ